MIKGFLREAVQPGEKTGRLRDGGGESLILGAGAVSRAVFRAWWQKDEGQGEGIASRMPPTARESIPSAAQSWRWRRPRAR